MGTATVIGYNKDELPAYIKIPEATEYQGQTYDVVAIGENAFRECDILTSVIIPNSVTTIGLYAFQKCKNLISVTVPNSVTEIGNDCFASASKLESITLGENVKTIWYALCADCTSLTTIYYNCIDCETIDRYLSYQYPPFGDENWKLTTLYIGEKVEKIGKLTFSKCDKFKDIYVSATTPPTCDTSDNFSSTAKYDATLHVPFGTLETYKAAPVWKEFRNIVENVANGIEDIKADRNNNKNMNVYYDLNGRRLNAPKKGLNIVNRKKVIF